MSSLTARKAKKSRKPTFYVRGLLPNVKWRRRTGLRNKARRHKKSRIAMPSPGYGSPADVRGFHPSGMKEKVVYTERELMLVDPKTEAVKIASAVGNFRRSVLQKKAEEMGIKILNPKKIEIRGVKNVHNK